MSRQIISTPDAPAAIGTYSQAVRVGNTIWVSGQIPLDPATKELVKGDMEAQVRQVFDNLKAIVVAAGATFDDVVKATVFLMPLRYEDRTRVVPLGELRAGQRAAVEGEVLLTEVVFRGRRQMLCKIADGSGFLTLRFFYFTAQQQKGLARGARIRCFGEARRGPNGL